ncbi:hypothetical protein [Actinoplanes sp. NPDC049316]|uniref:hypothetical protein n=1 Tax=Actinoplanes sp. NPDC049316 TaxID=3154727 RepID=UPI00343CC33B
MAITHVVVLVTALLCLPCAVAVVVCADTLPLRRAWTRGGRRETRALRCLDRHLNGTGVALRPPTDRPCLEEVAADLRRLRRQRSGGPTTGSALWLAAVVRAYDDRLLIASEAYGVQHHLNELEGMDRELERMRVEERLRAAGLQLR